MVIDSRKYNGLDITKNLTIQVLRIKWNRLLKNGLSIQIHTCSGRSSSITPGSIPATAAGPLGRGEDVDVCLGSIPDIVDIRDFGSDEILITTVEVKKDVECLVAQCGEGVGGVLCIASGHHHDHTPEPEQEQHPDKTGHRGYRQGYGET